MTLAEKANERRLINLSWPHFEDFGFSFSFSPLYKEFSNDRLQ